ncbi:MAG: ATP synthase F1 subunit gamma [Thermodesulfobacteriota bacterium]
MASLKDVKRKIGSVKKTRQITKAMNMVAASRLRGSQIRMEAFRPYASKFAQVLGSLAERSGSDASPLLQPRENVKNIHVVLCTSDRGLCGGFNTSLIEAAQDFLESKPDKAVSFTLFGKKGRDWARRTKKAFEKVHLGVVGTRFPFSVASKSGQSLINDFLGGKYDEVYVIYSRFVSMSRQVPVLQQVLPIPPIAQETDLGAEGETGQYLAEHICEPSAPELLAALLPKNVFIQIYSALLETSTSEQAARMMAMDNATKACNDMLDQLTLAYNKARQSAITTELMDIVGGAEALKG